MAATVERRQARSFIRWTFGVCCRWFAASARSIRKARAHRSPVSPGYSHQRVTQLRDHVPLVTAAATARVLSHVRGIAAAAFLQKSSELFRAADQAAADEHLRH